MRIPESLLSAMAIGLETILVAAIFGAAGAVLSWVITAAYFRQRYAQIRKGVTSDSIGAFVTFILEHEAYVRQLDEALNVLATVQSELSTARTRVSDARNWIAGTTIELEALEAIKNMPARLKDRDDSWEPART